jgi:hypothetical protein
VSDADMAICRVPSTQQAMNLSVWRQKSASTPGL